MYLSLNQLHDSECFECYYFDFCLKAVYLSKKLIAEIEKMRKVLNFYSS